MKKLLVALLFSTTAFAQDITPAQVLEKYFTAIGGRANIEKLQDFESTLETEIQGQPFVMTYAKKLPNKLFMVQKMGDMELNNITSDGTKAKVIAQGNEQIIEGENLKAFEAETHIIPELSYLKDGVTLKAEPAESVNNEECYVLSVEGLPGVTAQKEYFSKATGLKLRQDKETMGFSTTIYYSNYKEYTPGVKFAMDWKQEVMGQVLDLTVTSLKVNGNLPDSKFEVK